MSDSIRSTAHHGRQWPAHAHRRIRHEQEEFHLWQALQTLLEAAPVATPVGRDPLLERLQPPLGLSFAGLANMRVRVGSRIITVVAVPKRTWFNPRLRPKLHALKAAARKLGVRIVLVPSRAVRREPRISNARLIAGCKDHAVLISDRVAILHQISKQPGVHLQECADLVKHGDPVAAILALVADGSIQVAMDEHISPVSALYCGDRRSGAERSRP